MPGFGKWTVLLWLLTALPCAAQYSVYNQEPARWHLTGSFGFGLDHDGWAADNGLLQSNSSSMQYGGDIQAALSGHVVDPRFLTFTTGISDTMSHAGGEASDSSTAGRSVNLIATFLNGRGSPLTISYVRSNVDFSGFGGGQNNLTSSLGLLWNLNMKHVPRTTISYQSGQYNTDMPQSLTQNDSKTRSFAVSSGGDFAGWHGGMSFTKGSAEVSTLGLLALSAPQNSHSTDFSGDLNRSFWGQKGTVNVTGSADKQNSGGVLGSYDSSNLVFNGNMGLQWTEKLSSQLSAGWSRTNIDSNLQNGELGIPVALLSGEFSEHDLGGGTRYRLLPWLTLNGDASYTGLSPLQTASEAVSSLFTVSGGAGAVRKVHGIDLNATGSVGRQFINGDRGSTAAASLLNLLATAGWGNLSRVRLTGGFGVTRSAMPLILNGYNHERRIFVQAERAEFHGWRVAARLQRSKREVLSTSGLLTNDLSAFSVSGTSRRVVVNFSQTFSSGYGYVFPNPIVQVPAFTRVLPIEDLLASPLLNQDQDGRSVSVTAYLKRTLDVTGTWTQNSQTLPTAEQGLDGFEVVAHYRYGKFTFAGGFAHYTNDLQALTFVSNTTTLRNRYYFHIARSFTIF